MKHHKAGAGQSICLRNYIGEFTDEDFICVLRL